VQVKIARAAVSLSTTSAQKIGDLLVLRFAQVRDMPGVLARSNESGARLHVLTLPQATPSDQP
jgi:hypothetical protein